MWTRQIIVVGDSHGVTLPQDIMRGMEWKRGDILILQVLGPNAVKLSKLNPPRDVELAQAVVDLSYEPNTTGAN